MNPLVLKIGQKVIMPRYVQITHHTLYGMIGMRLSEICILQMQMGNLVFHENITSGIPDNFIDELQTLLDVARDNYPLNFQYIRTIQTHLILIP